MRTPPPISTSSPRDTTTPPRPASPTARAMAAALLLVTNASSPPVSATRWSSATRARGPRRPVERSSSRSRYPPARSAAAAATPAGHGARPRFVWMITPVALMTGSTPAEANPDSRSRASSARAVTSRGSAPPASRTRSPSIDVASHRRQGGRVDAGRLGSQERQDALDARRSRGRAGGGHRCRLASVAGARGSRTHRAAPSAAPLVLKTRGPTGTRPLPRRW